jgi:hypothetical protein
VLRRWFAVLILTIVSAPLIAAEAPPFHGLLRARDLSPFGYLRLDMRPGFSSSATPGEWTFGTDIAYQNTWATSPNVEKWLNSLEDRHELGPADYQALRDLEGENYLVDLELAQLDVTINYQFTEKLGGYVILSGASFGGGFLDSTIEGFHELIDAPEFGRPATARNDYNVLFDLKGSEFAAFESASEGGLLDPVVGVRYTSVSPRERWRVSLESAVKIPLSNRNAALSTGRTDFGTQVSVQRFAGHHALYANVAVVYYAGMNRFVSEPARVLPTLVVGYERRVTPRTNAILQGYVSRSIYGRQETELQELRGTKTQLSAGIHHRRGAHLITFALTENIGYINNTPDFGWQIGYSFNPGWN